MKASVWPTWLFPLALLLGGPSSAEKGEEHVRRGNDAFAQGDYRQAIQEYAQAERHFRCSLEGAAGERLPRTLYDLGNCLVQQAGEKDVGLLTQAIGCYQDCLKHTDADAELLEDARANLDLAQHLKAQTAQ